MTDDEKIGAKILSDSLVAPIRKILENAGFAPDVIINQILVKDDVTYGYDVLNTQYCNMVESGIIDPTEVVVSEVQNASSIGGLLLTTDCLITDLVEDKSAVPTGGCPPGGCNPGMMG